MTAIRHRQRLRAERVVGCERADVYAFLADVSNHRRLADGHMRLASLDVENHRACIVLNGPLGLRRTVHATVTRRRPPLAWGGTAAVGRHTRADVVWHIEPDPRGSLVVLSADVSRAGILDGLLLALGGRGWLRRRFCTTLARLEAALDDHSCGSAHHHAVRAAQAMESARS